MKEKEMTEEVEVPQGTEVKIENGLIKVKGKKGECEKRIRDPKIIISVKEGVVVMSAKNATKREKTRMGAYKSHIKNLIHGANEGYAYKLKMCAGHFPMTVTLTGRQFVVKNFLGEKYPRTLTLKEGVEVKIEGDFINVQSCNVELAGQTAADIEKVTRITRRDLRVFQDGIYIIEKDGKPIR